MSKTSKEQVEYWDKILDQYENSIGLPAYNRDSLPEKELNQYLSMNRDELEKLTPQDCGQIAYRISQFVFHLQRTINREIARHNWAEEEIKITIADDINNYKGYGYIEKSYQAIKHNEKAYALNQIKKYAKQRNDRLSYMANSLKNLSDILVSVQRTKSNPSLS
tara:strand:- start:2016 stop:2507 length:492 start_codon:yes stop_codon:yes gene_type:complete